jgi:hypothetical protein
MLYILYISNNIHNSILTKIFKMTKFTCVQCLKDYSSNGNLKKHIREVHDMVKHSCNLCEFQSTQKRGLDRHIKALHTKIRDHCCETCDYKSSDKCSLTAHEAHCTGGFTGSSGEYDIIQILNDMKVDYVYDVSYWGVKDKSLLRWDFIINPDSDTPAVLEFDGGFHYKPIRMGRQTQEQAVTAFNNAKRRDKIKDDYCNDNDIYMIRIPYWRQKDLDSIVREFVKMTSF